MAEVPKYPEGAEEFQAPVTEQEKSGVFEWMGGKFRSILPVVGLFALYLGGPRMAEAAPRTITEQMKERAFQMTVSSEVVAAFSPESVRFEERTNPKTGQKEKVRVVEARLNPQDNLFEFYLASPTNQQELTQGKDFLMEARNNYVELVKKLEALFPQRTAEIKKIIGQRFLQWGGGDPSQKERSPIMGGKSPEQADVGGLVQDIQGDLLTIDLAARDWQPEEIQRILEEANRGEVEIAKDFVGHWASQSPEGEALVK